MFLEYLERHAKEELLLQGKKIQLEFYDEDIPNFF